MPFAGECGGREWHEFRPSKLMIEPLIDGWVLCGIQDRAISESPRTIVHSTVEPTNDRVLSKHVRDMLFDVVQPLTHKFVFTEGILDLRRCKRRPQIHILEWTMVEHLSIERQHRCACAAAAISHVRIYKYLLNSFNFPY